MIAMLYGIMVVVAFALFTGTLAVVSEQTERHLEVRHRSTQSG